MAKYIKQEMPDIAGKGENAVYYRMQTERNIGAAEFVEKVAGLGTGLSEGAVTHVLEQMTQTLARLLADGHTVTIGGLGTFRTSVGVVEGKEQDTFGTDEPKRNAQSIEVKGGELSCRQGSSEGYPCAMPARTWQGEPPAPLALYA